MLHAWQGVHAASTYCSCSAPNPTPTRSLKQRKISGYSASTFEVGLENLLILKRLERQLSILPHILLFVAEGKHRVAKSLEEKPPIKMLIDDQFHAFWASTTYVELALYSFLAIVLYASLTTPKQSSNSNSSVSSSSSLHTV